LLVASLLAVHVLAAVVAIQVLAGSERRPLFVFVLVMFGQGAGLGSLLGIWAALGGRPTLWRLVGTTMALVGCMALAECMTPVSIDGHGLPVNDLRSLWVAVVFSLALATSLPLLALRFLGLEIAHREPDDSLLQRPKLQFSLRSLLEWTAALALMLGTLQMTPGWFPDVALAPLGLCPICGLLALAALWITLGTRWRAIRMLGLALAGASLVAGLVVLRDLDFLSPVWLLWIVSVIGSLWVFRIAGYRLVWRGRVTL
jgi:hypothetical protein